jgi:hypothetical protein
METIAKLLRNDSVVSAAYELHFPVGYGLPFWLFLPITFATNGAVAVRVALWCTLMLFPLAQLALGRAFRRPDWFVLLSLPLAFNISYWYGLLSGLFAQPFVLFATAAFVHALDSQTREPAIDPGSTSSVAREPAGKPAPTSAARWLILLNLAATVTLLSHLVAFVVLGLIIAALSLSQTNVVRALRSAALGLALPVALSLSKVFLMAGRAVESGPWPPTEYNLASHFVWFFQTTRPEGLFTILAPLLVSLVFVVQYLRSRATLRRDAFIAFVAVLVLALITPKTLSGIFLISVRLPVFLGMLALVLIDDVSLSRPIRGALLTLSALALLQVAVFHERFARAVDGLEAMTHDSPPAKHGYVSLVGRNVLGSRHVYLDHLGNWWTARHGGTGHNFFADADHHPVRFRPGVNIPADLWNFEPSELESFDQLLVYGDAPLPKALENWPLLDSQGLWKKLERPTVRNPAPNP